MHFPRNLTDTREGCFKELSWNCDEKLFAAKNAYRATMSLTAMHYGPFQWLPCFQ